MFKYDIKKLIINMKYKNTLNKKGVRVLIFQKNKEWIGVALDFNIVETGKELKKVVFSLDEAIRGYLITANKNKRKNKILNQTAEKEYELLWSKLENNQKISPSIKIHSFDRRPLVVV